jgi:hypothetical protein
LAVFSFRICFEFGASDFGFFFVLSLFRISDFEFRVSFPRNLRNLRASVAVVSNIAVSRFESVSYFSFDGGFADRVEPDLPVQSAIRNPQST